MNQRIQWQVIRKNGLKPFRLQRAQNLEDVIMLYSWIFAIGYIENVDFTNTSCSLMRLNSLLMANHNQNYRSNENQYATVESNDRYRFSIKVCCDMINNQLLGPVVLNNHLTGAKYRLQQNCMTFKKKSELKNSHFSWKQVFLFLADLTEFAISKIF